MKVLDKLRVHIAIGIDGVLAEFSFVEEHFGFEYCLMLLLLHTTSKQISRVNFSDAAICVLLFNRDDDFSLSLFLEFGYLLVLTFSWFLVIIVIL